MMYYIDKPNTWKATNKKCEQVQAFVDQFRNCLIAAAPWNWEGS